MGDETLTETELALRIKIYYPELSVEKAREKAIEQWAEQQQIKTELSKVLPEKASEQEIELEKDRMDYSLYSLENEYVAQHLDTLISAEEIQKYYDLHRENYKKETYIVQALYMKLPDTIAAATNANKYYLLKNDKDYQEIKNIGNLYASSFYLEDRRWIFFDDLMREIPITSSQKVDLIKNKKHAIFKKDGETHFVNILNYRTKTVSSPLNFEIERIKQHILIKRSNQLRDKAKEIILNDVKEKYPISYY